MKKKRSWKKYISWTLIAFFALGCSLILSFFLQSDSQLYQVTERYNSNVLSQKTPGVELYKGSKIQGEIKSGFSNLGIVAVKFNTYNRINNDTLIFKIKQKGMASWYYENVYKTDQFQNDQLFPFGFPLIANSNGKTYSVEITSQNGKKGNAVALSSHGPIMKTTYQYSSQLLLASGLGSLKFITIKYFGAFNTLENSILVVSPFAFFVVLRLVKLKNIFRWVFLFLVGATFTYIFYLGKLLPGDEVDSWGIIICIVIVWAILFIRYAILNRIWFILAMIMLTLSSVVFITLKRPDVANRSATVAYLFLCAGLIHSLLNELKRPPHQMTEWLVLDQIIGQKYSLILKKNFSKVMSKWVK
jgi:hypothetical protein